MPEIDNETESGFDSILEAIGETPALEADGAGTGIGGDQADAGDPDLQVGLDVDDDSDNSDEEEGDESEDAGSDTGEDDDDAPDSDDNSGQDEGRDSDDELDIPATIEDFGKTPEERESRWKRLSKGFRKEHRLANEYRSLGKADDVKGAIRVFSQLESKDDVGRVLPYFIEVLRGHHGAEVIDKLLGTKAVTPPSGAGSSAHESSDSESLESDLAKALEDYELVDRDLLIKSFPSFKRWAGVDALQAEISKLQATIEEMRGSLDSVKASTNERKQQTAFEDRVKATLPKINKHLAREFHGYQVTAAQVIEAATAHKEVAKKNAVDAVKVHFAKEIAKHIANKASRNAPKRPDMPESTKRGRTPRQSYGWDDILREIGEEPVY